MNKNKILERKEIHVKFSVTKDCGHVFLKNLKLTLHGPSTSRTRKSPAEGPCTLGPGLSAPFSGKTVPEGPDPEVPNPPFPPCW